MKTEIGLLRLGELDVVCIPGEIYPELVLDKVQDPADRGADFPDAPIEPGIYIAPNTLGVKKAFRGIGVRIEDDVAVTRTGAEVVTSKAPKDVDDIESLMAHG